MSAARPRRPAPPPSGGLLLSVPGVAKTLGLSVKSVRNLIARGLLPAGGSAGKPSCFGASSRSGSTGSPRSPRSRARSRGPRRPRARRGGRSTRSRGERARGSTSRRSAPPGGLVPRLRGAPRVRALAAVGRSHGRGAARAELRRARRRVARPLPGGARTAGAHPARRGVRRLRSVDLPRGRRAARGGRSARRDGPRALRADRRPLRRRGLGMSARTAADRRPRGRRARRRAARQLDLLIETTTARVAEPTSDAAPAASPPATTCAGCGAPLRCCARANVGSGA